jgi:hypothetical protein
MSSSIEVISWGKSPRSSSMAISSAGAISAVMSTLISPLISSIGLMSAGGVVVVISAGEVVLFEDISFMVCEDMSSTIGVVIDASAESISSMGEVSCPGSEEHAVRESVAASAYASKER